MKKLDKIQSVSITVACICLVVTILMSFLYLSKTNELDDVKAQLKSVQLTSETSGNHTDITIFQPRNSSPSNSHMIFIRYQTNMHLYCPRNQKLEH